MTSCGASFGSCRCGTRSILLCGWRASDPIASTGAARNSLCEEGAWFQRLLRNSQMQVLPPKVADKQCSYPAGFARAIALSRYVDSRLDESSARISQQSDDETRNNADDWAYAGHHQARRVGKRHRTHHSRLSRVIRDVLSKKYDVCRGHPDAVHNSDQQAMKKLTVRPLSRNEVCAREENEQPEDRLDIRANHEHRCDAHSKTEKRQAEDQFPVHI